MKKTGGFQKTCGFYTYFEIVFWHQRRALKNDIPSFRGNLYDLYRYKSFFSVLNNIFLKFWNNWHMWHTFLCFIILAKWRFCRNFDYLIFTVFLLHLDFSTLFFQFFCWNVWTIWHFNHSCQNKKLSILTHKIF